MSSVVIRKSLLQLVFSGAFMKRWNDRLRPMELMEVDKQAHKMIAAWMLLTRVTANMAPAERLALVEEVIEGGLFSYFYRLVITDIKPPVFYKIKANREDYQKLTQWVLPQLKARLAPLGPEFWERMTASLMEPEEKTLARRILMAAHLYASYSEFRVLRPMNPHDEEMPEIEESFRSRLADLSDIPGVAELLSGEGEFSRFAARAGQLRFQKRWSQTPRVPETTVLGHMFLVASYAWFFSVEAGACQARRQNNFFAGLFHDLPELLTRDIISPVKSADASIGELIKQYETQELERKIIGPLNQGGCEDLAERLSYLMGLEVGSEFIATVREPTGSGVEVRNVTEAELLGPMNRDELDPKDGPLLKMCDRLAAFIEADTALTNGINNEQLHQARWRIRQFYENRPEVMGIQVGALLADFN
ncbi:putative hydrolases of HD superfamily [Humidesulfovibrio mexicanus]|uniref:Putative hydrolases of HD superfamily n=1 Tax=Humidesulfovibrio mexicanus TaxID=147047 RepID=A0A239ANI8_9BACT|nr:HD domain-containing protein [Humidesulfovibrio mexicanus]SNR96568.1 putative hydrolases of HD superfamily [Humidesulfovibrio mexicanus]